MKMNRILSTDSYKLSHFAQYPKGREKVFSYLESRGSERHWDETVFFGLQYILKEYFSEPITHAELDEAVRFIPTHAVPFNAEGWRRLIDKHKGRLPLCIRAVAEGSVVPTHNVLITVVNTDPEFPWVTSYFETILMRLWYPITVATQSYQLKKLIYRYLKETADEPDNEILFKLHDFGA